MIMEKQDCLDEKTREQKFLAELSIAATRFYDIRDQIDHVLIVAHSDADGYAAAAILEKMLQREHIACTVFFFNRESPWDVFLEDMLANFNHIENLTVFFADVGSDLEDIVPVFEDDVIEVFILDHHELRGDCSMELPEVIHLVNPSIYGYDGIKEIAGATLAYLFAKEISLSNIDTAWIALIGISLDCLMNISNYRSFNKEVLEEAIQEEQIIVKDGLFVYGATNERVSDALAHSLYPYVKEVAGDEHTAYNDLVKLGVDPKKKVEDLDESEVNTIDNFYETHLKGQYAIFPKKRSLLRYPFEHGLMINIGHHFNRFETEQLIAKPTCSGDMKKEYRKYTTKVTTHLSRYMELPKIITPNVILVEADKSIPKDNWGDVSSYSSVNKLYNANKILLLGGDKGDHVKLHVRCSEDYPPLKEGKGCDVVIEKMKNKFGGVGGGHKLAGSYKIAPNRFKKLKKNIDDIFPL